MSRDRLTFALALLPLALALGASAEEAPPPPPPLEIEVGWRFVNVSGNEDLFRTQIGERPGFLVRSLRYSLPDESAKGFADSFRIDAIDLGAGPAGSFRLQAGKSGIWKADLSYRRWDRFSVNDGWANPARVPGTLPGLHSRDRTNEVVDLQVEALPGRAITPFVGLTWSRLRGPSTTTVRAGEDEFRLDSTLNDRETELTFGASFEAGIVSGRVSQGWRFLRGEESLVLSSGAGAGVSADPVYGRNQTLTSYTREGTTDVDTPVTNLAVNLRPVDRLTIQATYVRSAATADSTDVETLAGSLTSYPIRAFFSGLAESASASADSTFWRGSARAEYTVIPGVDLGAAFSRRDRSLTGAALVTSLYTGATDLNGLNPGDLQKLVEAQTSLDRTDDELSFYAAARHLGPFSLRASYAKVDEDLSQRQDLSQIVIPGSQEGDFTRSLRRYEGAAGFRESGIVLGVQYRTERADETILRTDVERRNRWRLTAALESPTWLPWFRLAGSFTRVDEKNEQPGIDYSGESREWNVTAEGTILKVLRLRASGGRLEGDWGRLYRRPQDFVIDRSLYSEDAVLYEAGLALDLTFARLDGSYGYVDGTGTLGYDIRRGRVLLDVPIGKKLGAVVDWSLDRYDEPNSVFHSEYSANRLGLFLRVCP